MEQSFLAYLRGRCRALPQVELGIGDDAAVLSASSDKTVICTDQIVDGVDFLSSEHSLANVGFKSMAINLSDIAAMGAVPICALVTLTLPAKNATRIAGDVYEGILEAAAKYRVAIAGGDISTYDITQTDAPLAINVTLIGTLPSGPEWRRNGAQEGDLVLVSGAVGGSIRGRHLRPTPRIELVNQLREHCDVHAAIDISDGFSLDLDRLCATSGVGVEIDIDAIPIHEDAKHLSETSGRTPFQHAWSDGEDFELIITLSESDYAKIATLKLEAPLTKIGTIVGRTGIWKRVGSKFERLSPQGYHH